MRFLTLLTGVVLLSAPAKSWAEPVSDALFARFLTVMPDRDRFNTTNLAPLDSDVAKLLAGNPGKEKAIREVLLKQVQCNAASTKATVMETLRSSLDMLGTEKATRVTDFYAGEGQAKIDRARLDSLNAQMKQPGVDSPAVDAEMLTILNRYSLVEFATIMQQEAMRIGSDWRHVEVRKACWDANVKAMRKAKLKVK